MCSTSSGPVAPSGGSTIPPASSSPPIAPMNVLVQIKLDQFPIETSWYIETIQGEIIHDVPIYSYITPLATVSEVVTLDSTQQYRLIVMDSFGDGCKFARIRVFTLRPTRSPTDSTLSSMLSRWLYFCVPWHRR